MRSVLLKTAGLACAAGIAVVALPSEAYAWWRGGVFIGVAPVAPLYVPPRVYAPAPAYYYPPAVAYAPAPAYPRVWVRPHWNGWRWVPGYWR